MSTIDTAKSTNIYDDKQIFPNLPNGPLTQYRKRASFDYKKFALTLESEESLRLKHKIWNFFETNLEFARSSQTLTMNDSRRQITRQMFVMLNEQFYTLTDHVTHPELASAYIASVMSYDPSFAIKMGLCFHMFSAVLRSMGTERVQKYADACEKGEIFGSFALTEIAHGSNVLGMRTTATYDPKTKEFIIHSPNFEAAKCWIGNLGKTCTHAIVYAQLYTADGEHHGLSGFLIPIRNTKTLQAFAGVLVGDLGEKVGLTGLDNGFVMFNNYRIPRENLLAKTGDVTADGKYVSPIKDKRKRLGASFGALSGGRANICGIANTYLVKAITIAIRYSASRKQFGPENDVEEFPVLEYESQQYRLLPHLATACAQKIFAAWILLENTQLTIKTYLREDIGNSGMEMHALSSAAKPVCTWSVRDAIQDCREACGGHGYLKVAGIGDLRNDNDANCTYEGENNVLLQQTSNWLLSIRRKGYSHFQEYCPLGSAAFLVNFKSIIAKKLNYSTSEEALDPKNILNALDCLCAWILEETGKKSDQLENEGKSAFEVRNGIQVFYACTLSVLYAQRAIFNIFFEHISRLENSSERKILTYILSLYGGNVVIKYIGLLYEGGFIAGQKIAQLYKHGIIDILSKLKDEAVAIVDAIAPTDFILNSPLGMSDGEIYRHLQSSLMQSPEVFERPDWWKDVVHWQNYVKVKL